MAKYRFVEWRDETGAVVSTSPILTYAVLSDKTFTAVYELVPPVIRVVTYESTPIAVPATIDGASIQSGQSVEVEDGTAITVSVQSEVET